jgi:hypothetical protein
LKTKKNQFDGARACVCDGWKTKKNFQRVFSPKIFEKKCDGSGGGGGREDVLTGWVRWSPSCGATVAVVSAAASRHSQEAAAQRQSAAAADATTATTSAHHCHRRRHRHQHCCSQ